MNEREWHEIPIHERGPTEWFLAIRANAEPTAETIQAWLKWLDASPHNRQTFEQLVEVWDRTPAAVIAAGARPAGEDHYDGSIPITEWRRRNSCSARRAVTGAVRWRWLGVAAALLLAIAGTALHWASNSWWISQGEFFTTTGEQRQLHLADGSTITLGPRSSLSVALNPDSRTIRLGYGEAYFSVARDLRRPFVVHAFQGAITAVGTAFDVRALVDRVTVTVAEGRIALRDDADLTNASASMRDPGSTLLSLGEQISYSANSHTARIEASSINRVNSSDAAHWRDGWLVYRNEPLRYVIADISRYTELKLNLAGTAGNIPFSGAVYRGRIAEWLAALPEVANVSVERDGRGYNIDSRVQ